MAFVGRFCHRQGWIWCRLLLLSSMSAIVFMAEIQPKEPLIASGEMMNVTCNLTEDDLEPNSVYFNYDGKDVSPDLVTVTDDRTVGLNMPNMARGERVLQCKARGRDLPLDSVTVTVADKPVKPVIKECRVKNWKKMTCWWEPAVQDTGIPTTQTLFYTLVPNSNDDWHECDQTPYPPGNCAFAVTSRSGVHLTVMARSSIAKNIFSEPLSVKPYEEVEPNPVENLEAEVTSSTQAIVRWKAPLERKEILYEITYSPEWDDTSRTKNVSDKSKKAILSGLLPYTTYTVTVRCIPIVRDEVKGFWSKERTTTFKTHENVPGAAPIVTAGSFQRLTPLPGDSKVKVFWQEIPEPQKHGIITAYKVQWGEPLSETLDYAVETGSSVQRKEISLDPNTTYEVMVTGRTKVGYNETLAPTRITISPESEAPSLPQEVIAQGNKSGIYLTWQEDSTDNVSYTVYWCRGSRHEKDCLESLHWEQTDSTVFQISVSGDYADYIVAVSAESTSLGELLSSGMVWADCVHDMGRDLKTPEEVKLSRHQPSGGFSVEWYMPSCATTAYISGFQVAYCTGQQCHMQDMYTYLDVDRTRHSATVSNLEVDSTYDVWVRSVGLNNKTSAFSHKLSHKVRASGLTAGAIAGIVIGSLVVIFLIALGLYTIINGIRKRKKVLRDIGGRLKVERPPPLKISLGELEPQDNYSNGAPGQDSRYLGSGDMSTPHRLSENLQNAWTERPPTYQNDPATLMLNGSHPSLQTESAYGSHDGEIPEERQPLQPSGRESSNGKNGETRPQTPTGGTIPEEAAPGENVGLLSEQRTETGSQNSPGGDTGDAPAETAAQPAPAAAPKSERSGSAAAGSIASYSVVDDDTVA